MLTVFYFGFAQENTIKLKSGEISLNTIKQLDRIDNIKYYFMSFSALSGELIENSTGLKNIIGFR